jgi:FkbM family methyltransferase
MIIAGKLFIPEGDAYFQRVFARSGDRFQQDLFDAALTLTRGRQTAIDVGAHVGSWTRQMAQKFDDVIAFEPHPENFKCLQENTRGLDITRMNAALGNEEGECDMVQHNDNSGCWRVVRGAGVKVVRLDAFRFKGVDLIKIDVEGFEGAVIQGATRTINECAPTIVFEDNGLGPRAYGEAWIDPKPILTELGYRQRKRISKDEIWTPR